MTNINYNPDVLDAIANLSSDEVFTPPKIANEILDMLPQELFEDKNRKFLDPVCKSGVFLREIAKRLMKGLEKEIPDIQTRANHIFGNQLFGIAITELTSLLSRRTLYGSKRANSKYSFCDSFEDESGNIIFNKTKHTWKNGKCIYCGASKDVYNRDESLESYAYKFIHTTNPQELFNMKFDVIIGNPPYQLKDGGAGASAKPIYHKFIQQAKKLNPKYLSFIVPARWYNGGKGLDEFRKEILNDDRLAQLHDFPDTSDCFPGLNIRGGVCYFLWDKQHSGKCEIYNYKNRKVINHTKRNLLEKDIDIFIRYNAAIDILHKVRLLKEKSFKDIVSSRKPFGLATNFKDFYKNKKNDNDVYLYRFGDNGYIEFDKIKINQDLIKEWKVLVSKASPGDDSFPHLILSKPIISEPNSCCTETYILVGPFENENIAKNVVNYMKTYFFRFMVLLAKSTQDVTKKTYQFVPMQDFSQSWDDEKLYKKYALTQEEIDFIESMIKPMD